ncbi:hypothetical protein C8R45DRAFT_936032 [Mycena sanguinolenta]|nr:hypothetical protein C8R45DRAFT_936032 [Mycena sanguinolenta]
MISRTKERKDRPRAYEDRRKDETVASAGRCLHGTSSRGVPGEVLTPPSADWTSRRGRCSDHVSVKEVEVDERTPNETKTVYCKNDPVNESKQWRRSHWGQRKDTLWWKKQQMLVVQAGNARRERRKVRFGGREQGRAGALPGLQRRSDCFLLLRGVNFVPRLPGELQPRERAQAILDSGRDRFHPPSQEVLAMIFLVNIIVPVTGYHYSAIHLLVRVDVWGAPNTRAGSGSTVRRGDGIRQPQDRLIADSIPGCDPQPKEGNYCARKSGKHKDCALAEAQYLIRANSKVDYDYYSLLRRHDI